MTALMTWIALLLAAYTMYVITSLYRFFSTQKRSHRKPDHHPFITVIVAARNEESCITKCMDSIAKQNYPKDKCELIIVDDHSEDRTVDMVNKHLTSIDVRLFACDASQKGKKNALTIGVEHAKGSIIAVTDADCLVPPDWLQQIAAGFVNENIHLLTGPVIYKRSGLLSAFLNTEQIAIQITSVPSVGKIPMMASGANLAYRKSSFHECGGYEGDTFVSGDDMLLMQRINRKFGNGVGYLNDQAAIVLTEAVATFRESIVQRARWLSKMKGLESAELRSNAILIFLSNLVVPCFVFLSIIKGYVVFSLGKAVLYKFGIDLLLLSLSVPFFKEPSVLFVLPFSEIFYPFLMAAAMIRSRSLIKWKGRIWKK